MFKNTALIFLTLSAWTLAGGMTALADGPAPRVMAESTAVSSSPGGAVFAAADSLVVEGKYLVLRARASASQQQWDELRTVVQAHAGSTSLVGVVLDLRLMTNQTETSVAGRLASLFLPANTELFQIKKSTGKEVVSTAGSSPLEHSPLVILVRRESSPVALALAAGLRGNKRGVLVGSVSIKSPTNSYPVTSLPAGEGSLERAGQKLERLSLDVPVATDLAAEQKVLSSKTVDAFLNSVTDRESTKRLREASLVKGENPEVDIIKERLDKERLRKLGKTNAAPDSASSPDASAEAPELKDRPLQGALDVLRGLDALGLIKSAATEDASGKSGAATSP